MQKYLLYIFNPSEQLVAILKPDTDRTNQPGVQQDYLIQPFQLFQGYTRENVSGCQYYNAAHTEQLNGQNTFTFSVPADHANAQYVTEGHVVAFRDRDDYWQFFEICRVLDVHGSEGLIRTSYCEHVLYELLDDIVTDRRPTDASAYTAIDAALTGTRWKAGICDDLGANSTNVYYISALAAVRNIAEIWSGEIQARLDVSGGIIAGRYIDIFVKRGQDTGKIFEYSKDIVKIEREADTTGVVTALYGRGKGVEIEETGGYGRRLTFSDVAWSSASGNPTDKPAGQEWVEDSKALAQWGRSGRHRFGVFEDEDETDAKALLQKTWDELQRRKIPRITYKLDVAELERLTGYGHEKVRLGDTVRVKDTLFNPPLLVKARIIELQRDLVKPENTKIVLGNFMPLLTDINVTLEKTLRDVRDKSGIWDRSNQFNPDGSLNTGWLNGTIDILANGLNSAISNWHTDENGNIIFLSADGLKAMKLTGEGFAISNQKNTNGKWVWRTFGTGAGFTADEINSGKIRAELIQIGAGTEFAEGFDPTIKETPAGAQAKADTAKAAALQKAMEAETAAKSYAEAQAAVARIAAESHADGIVTAEEQARINQANQVLADAKAHANVKAGEAKTAADIANQTANVANQTANNAQATANNASTAVNNHANQASPHNLPSYTKLTNTGIMVFDGSNNLRTHLGQYASGKYGLKVIEGEIYASSFTTSQPTNKSGCIDITKTGEFKAIGPSGNTTVYISGAYNDQGRIQLYDKGSVKSTFYINGGDTKDLIINNTGSSGIVLEAGTGEYIKMGPYWGSTDSRGLRLSGISEDLLPYYNESVWMGSSNKKWGTIYARYVKTGDLCFSEKECAICGKPFTQGDKLILLVNAIDEESTYTIPIHEGCKDKSASITIEMPEQEEYYFIGDDGEPQKGKRWKKEVVLCDCYRLKNGYEINEKTGQFKKKAVLVKIAKEDTCARITPNGVRYYQGIPRKEVELDEILEEVEVFPGELTTKETATRMETIEKIVPVMKKVTVMVGNPSS